MSSQIPLCLPNLPNLLTQPFNQIQHQLNLNLNVWLQRPQRSKEEGFSEVVAARIDAPQRGSTRSVYEAKWTIFTKWCHCNQVEFRAPPGNSIAKLVNSIINFSKDKNLNGLLDSYYTDRPKGHRDIPS